MEEDGDGDAVAACMVERDERVPEDGRDGEVEDDPPCPMAGLAKAGDVRMGPVEAEARGEDAAAGDEARSDVAPPADLLVEGVQEEHRHHRRNEDGVEGEGEVLPEEVLDQRRSGQERGRRRTARRMTAGGARQRSAARARTDRPPRSTASVTGTMTASDDGGSAMGRPGKRSHTATTP